MIVHGIETLTEGNDQDDEAVSIPRVTHENLDLITLGDGGSKCVLNSARSFDDRSDSLLISVACL